MQPHQRFDPEKIAYWYLRLNGFFQIDNFYVHPPARGSARTDADLLAVRFPYRAERIIDAPSDIMQDDIETLHLSPDCIEVVIAEVKRGQCKLNGPWTNPKDENIQRVLAAIGCFQHEQIADAANALYSDGIYLNKGTNIRSRLIAIGREPNHEISSNYPDVAQVTWTEILGFIFKRFRKYRHQKAQTDHWHIVGRKLKSLANKRDMTEADYVEIIMSSFKE